MYTLIEIKCDECGKIINGRVIWEDDYDSEIHAGAIVEGPESDHHFCKKCYGELID